MSAGRAGARAGRSLAVATLLALVVPGTIGGLSAQDPGACTSPESRQFDFWIGDWNVRQRILQQDGSYLELPAATSVSRALDGCALVEHWTGRVLFFWDGMREVEPMRGLSVRAYDPGSARWYIHWMDTRSPRFGDPYVGIFRDGRGEFFRDLDTPDGPRTGRISFTRVAADEVEWELAVSSDGGRSWQVLWTMAMRRTLAAREAIRRSAPARASARSAP